LLILKSFLQSLLGIKVNIFALVGGDYHERVQLRR
jgi:hypothetical protein